MGRHDVWHHYLSFHIWDWTELLAQNLEIIGFGVYPGMGIPKYGYTQVWVYPSTSRCGGAALPGAFFSKKTRPFSKKHVYCCFFVNKYEKIN